ncbi:hypothetical protein QZH41_001089 [Actinostola sp. cb2023]|nr:hypothetical protein QZH41_001089 [Actinostola sp. cb2023]
MFQTLGLLAAAASFVSVNVMVLTCNLSTFDRTIGSNGFGLRWLRASMASGFDGFGLRWLRAPMASNSDGFGYRWLRAPMASGQSDGFGPVRWLRANYDIDM